MGPAAIVATRCSRTLGAILDQPMAANCTSLTAGRPPTVTRVRWGGSLLEEAKVHGSPLLLTVAPHAVAAEPVEADRSPR